MATPERVSEMGLENHDQLHWHQQKCSAWVVEVLDLGSCDCWFKPQFEQQTLYPFSVESTSSVFYPSPLQTKTNNLCQSTFCSESDTFFAKAKGLEFSALEEKKKVACQPCGIFISGIKLTSGESVVESRSTHSWQPEFSAVQRGHQMDGQLLHAGFASALRLLWCQIPCRLLQKSFTCDYKPWSPTCTTWNRIT